MDIIIVCHTELGLVADKKIIVDKSAVSGVRNGVLNLQKIADKYQAKISYALCPEAKDFFPKQIDQEIGLHVHSTDLYIRKQCKLSSDSSVLRDYSYQEQYNMIKTGQDCLENFSGQKPKFFVAGRWSLNNDTVKALAELGFDYDCSAPAHSLKPHYDWSKISRICLPYYPNSDDYQKKGDLPLLIIPISQTIFGGTVNPEGVVVYGFAWLKACFSEYYKKKIPLFHICLHSPSMTDNYYLFIMDKFLSFISQHKDINFKFVSEIKEYREQDFNKFFYFPYFAAINKNLLKTAFKRILCWK